MNSIKVFVPHLLFVGIFMTCMASDPFIRIPLYRDNILSNSTSSDDIPLNYTRNGMRQFYGKMSAGTPRQNFTVLYDTGSSDMWLVSAECTTPQCMEHHRYDHNKSSSYIENGTYFNYIYGKSGNVSGFWSNDDITVGGIKVKKQQFGEVELEQFKPTLSTDGIVGMAFKKDGVNTVMDNMVQQNVIKNSVFSFYMSSHFLEVDQVGEMVLGGSDPKHYVGEFTYIPIVRSHNFPETWDINFDGLYINGKNFLTDASPIIIDTGYSGFCMPHKLYKQIIEELGADKYNISCSEVSKQPDIVFQFNGKQFPVKAKNYYYMVKDDVCRINFDSAPPKFGRVFQLGQMIMEQYYTEFDFGNRRIGFASSK